MSEWEWDELIQSLENKVSKRKLRLFAAACCRLIWPLFDDPRSRAAVEASEQFADGRITTKALAVFCQQAMDALPNPAWRGGVAGNAAVAVASGCCVPRHVVSWVQTASGGTRTWHPHGILFKQELVLRDIFGTAFGDPFRRIIVNPSWLTSTVTALAQGIYDERAFDRMPILADALMDAECDNEEILDHCRGAGRHVRGCWVLDLLLGKE